MRDDGEAPQIRAIVRAWDSVTIPSLGGVPASRSINLGYTDGTLPEMHVAQAKTDVPPADYASLSACRTNPGGILKNANPRPRWPDLVGDLRDILEYFRPDIIVTPHPVLDGHPDHRFTTVAVLEAMRCAKATDAAVYLYVNHLAVNELYPLGPADGMMTLPPSLDPARMDNVYSHLLAERQRQMKYFALEGMHDLRAAPIGDSITFWRAFRRFTGMLYARATGLGLDPNSYFRRALRPNELFFVVTMQRLDELVSEFLDGPKP